MREELLFLEQDLARSWLCLARLVVTYCSCDVTVSHLHRWLLRQHFLAMLLTWPMMLRSSLPISASLSVQFLISLI